MKAKIIILIGVMVLTFFVPASAGDNGGERYVLQRINGKVTLDGLSNESAWEGIKPLPVVMHIPEFGKEPTEKTEILVAYDNDYLYAAGRLYDSSPSKIQASSRKRDELGLNNDWFGLVIDAFNDKENALIFLTNPAGLRTDMTVFNDAQGDSPINSSWNTFWDVVTVRTDKGWFAEIRIPFSSLRFQDKEGQVVMGLIALRWIARKTETVIFPGIPRNWGAWSSYKPSRAQEVVLSGIRSRKPLYVAPYVLGGFGQTFELNDAGTSYQSNNDPAHEAGLDIKYGLTSNLTLDITINTDFAQVEADDQQVNLTRFSLFFPEKRLFFQERSSIFDFSFEDENRLFYSRRIGIHDGKPVRIYGGVRLVGRAGPWDLGAMTMQTAAVEDLSPENFSVVRLRRRVFNPYSYVGGIVTSRIGKDGNYNIAYGVDGIIRLLGDDYLIFKWAQTFENDGENEFLTGESSRIRVNWERRNIKGLLYNLGYSRSGASYNPGIGFENRSDYTRIDGRIGYGWVPGEKSKLLRYNFFLNSSFFISNRDESIESSDIGAGYEFRTKSGFIGKIEFKRLYEDVFEGFSFTKKDADGDEPDVPIGQYTFYGLEAMYSTPTGKLFSVKTNLYAGTFYDGRRFSLEFSPTWNIFPGLELSGTYQFNRIHFPQRDEPFNLHIARLRLLVTLSTRFSAGTFIQYNSAIEEITANIRLRYNPREGNDLYLVYNEGINTKRFRVDPALPFTIDRTIMLKYTYTFNL